MYVKNKIINNNNNKLTVYERKLIYFLYGT